MKYTILLAMNAILFVSYATEFQASAQQVATQLPGSFHAPTLSSYAEDLYKEYAAGTGGKISFEVLTEETGAMKALAGKPFSSLITVPSYRIVSDQFGTNLNNPRFYVPADQNDGLYEMAYTADEFNQHSLPLEDGSYRQLLVTATIGADVRSHEAMEFCWAALNHCAVLDPTVVFLQSKVNIRLSLAAAGWGPRLTPQVTTEAKTDTENVVAAASGTCGLASHPSWIGETLTWAAWTAWAKDVFGVTLWQENLAQQVAGISCNSACKPEPFATSSDSSSFANLGYTTACANRGTYGVTGSTAKSIAETKCTEEFVGHASASVTVKGSGDSVSLDWSLGGSSNSNGGTLVDSCGYF